MPNDLSQLDHPSDAPKGVDRRTLLKAGAWAAPVLVLTTAAPAMAASVETVPAAQLTATPGALTNAGLSGALGPLSWAGGTIAWSRSSPGDPTTASVSYTVSITGPDGVAHELITNSTNIVNGGSFPVSALSYGTAPLAAGAYTLTLTVFGNDVAKSATSTVTLVAPPVAVTSAASVIGGSGNKHSLTLTLTGPANTLVQIATTPTATTLSAAFPTSATIPVGGTFSVTRVANATGQTPGSVKFVLSGTNVVVTPSEIVKAIPVKSTEGTTYP